MRVFEAYLREIFAHEDANCNATLAELVQRHMADDIEAAAECAKDSPELTGVLCRRALHWYHLAKQLSQFLGAENAAEIEELPMVQRMHYRAELEAQYGSVPIAIALEKRPGSAPPAVPS